MASSKRSEDIYGEKLDRCLYNSLIKFVGGIGVGIVFSALLFKRKPWPVILGGGIGTGMGISDCNYEYKGTSIGRPPFTKKATGGGFFSKLLEKGALGSGFGTKSSECGISPGRELCCEQKVAGKSCLCKPKYPKHEHSTRHEPIKKSFPCKKGNKDDGCCSA